MECVLKDLISVSKDGEWGKGEPFDDSVEMLAIRGTDFEDVRLGVTGDIPRRHIAKRHAERKILQPWDVVIEAAGGTKNQITGRTVLLRPQLFARSDLPFTCASFSRFIRFNTELCDPVFVFWYLQHLYASGSMHAYHTQHTGVARFQWTTFSEREPLNLPPLPTQRRIAGILSAYDELIENSQRRIKILESMARALYREWFVHFRFPGHESVPLVPSPLGSIPQGWEVRKLGDISSYINRGIAPRYDEEGASVVINQKCVRDQRLNLEPARRQSKSFPSEKRVCFGDVLINSTGVGTLGRVAQVYENLENCTVDTHVTIARAGRNTDLDFYGCCLLSHQEVFERLGIGATGQTELGRGSIADIDLVVPPQTVQRCFGEIAKSMRTAAENHGKRIKILRRTRDLLLPRLLSGQIEVEAMPA